jgi:hypothetical protein
MNSKYIPSSILSLLYLITNRFLSINKEARSRKMKIFVRHVTHVAVVTKNKRLW